MQLILPSSHQNSKLDKWHLFLAPPAFSLERHKDEITLREGESLTHEVPFNGNPAPKVEWDFNRVCILYISHINIYKYTNSIMVYYQEA